MLFKTCAYGDIKYIKILIDYGADLNIENWMGDTALKEAQKLNHVEIVEILEATNENGIEKEEDPDAQKLLEAIKVGNLIEAEKLLEKELDVNARDNDDKTVLILAVNKGYIDIAETLIRKGADVNIKDEDEIVRSSATMALKN
ncbi:MAG: ankyrin repeat domain-containing protein [Actinomycetota bacterium]